MRTLLPMAGELPKREARFLNSAFIAALAMIGAALAHWVTGVGGPGFDRPAREWMLVAVLAIVTATFALRTLRAERGGRSVGLMAAGVCCYLIGIVVGEAGLSHSAQPPVPLISDAFRLAFYPLACGSALGYARRRGDDLPVGKWLDAVISASAVAAVGAAFVLPAVLASGGGEAGAVVSGVAYPAGDGLLCTVGFGSIVLRGWRLERAPALFIGFAVALAAADCLPEAQSGHGPATGNAMASLLYMMAFVLLAVATWQPVVSRPNAPLERWAVLLVPTGFTLGSVSLLVYDHFARLPGLAVALAVLTLIAAAARVLFTFRDVRALADTSRQALTDELTGLPNRRMFMSRLRAAANVNRAAEETVAMVMLDLDDFRRLNDTLGHDAGDTLLKIVAARLAQVVAGRGMVARLGGDEFAILWDSPADPAGPGRLAEDLLSALREPIRVQGLALRVAASAGIALLPLHADTPEGLVKCADIAMYLAKESRRGWEIYAQDRDKHSREQLVLADDLAVALERGGVEAHFQPIADTATGRVVGAEALVRWRRPDGSLIPPGEFVAVAESAGLSRHLTRRMIGFGLEQLRTWRASGFALYVSVNATVADLLDSDFPAQVAQALAAACIPPSALTLEVTESSILSDPVRIGAVLEQLREVGVGIGLDDFGTGYSSLAHLRTLPVDHVKIDRSFVTHMRAQAADAAIVYATIELAHKLGLRVVAEGVEDRQTWDALAKLGCDCVQGFVLGRPEPPAEFQRLLAERRFDTRPPATSAAA